MLRTPAFRLLLGLGLCSVGGAMLYIYFKNKDEDEDIDAIDGTPSFSNKQQINVRLVISNEIVPVLIGRSGTNLKIIEDKTGTSITFIRKNDDEHHYCEIRGMKTGVAKAKELIMKEIEKSSTVKEEIFVPKSSCGKISGNCGDALKEICLKSLAKVFVDSGDIDHKSTTRKVVIVGNRNQVNIAKKLIEQKVKKDEEYRKSIEQLEQTREPRRSPTNSISSNHSSMTSVNLYCPTGEKLNMSDTEKPLEVYVSAIASPDKFWLQLVGPKSRKLDELVESMTEYYEKEENKALHKIADPYLGQIVAALYKYDGKWYRAEIIGILPNEYNPRDVVLDLYFVDYGDSEYVAPHEVFELRTDFLTLRFQAIECFLAHVKPAMSNERDVWDQQSIAKFEELTHVANWKKLVSRIVTYKNRSGGRNHGKREGSPIPGVELFDTSGETEINIAHALISEGLATPDYPNSEKNDVLRLDGGDFTKFNENISKDISNNASCNLSNNSNNPTNDLNRLSYCDKSHNNQMLNGATNFNYPTNEDSENFLQTEQTSGSFSQNERTGINYNKYSIQG